MLTIDQIAAICRSCADQCLRSITACAACVAAVGGKGDLIAACAAALAECQAATERCQACANAMNSMQPADVIPPDLAEQGQRAVEQATACQAAAADCARACKSVLGNASLPEAQKRACTDTAAAADACSGACTTCIDACRSHMTVTMQGSADLGELAFVGDVTIQASGTAKKFSMIAYTGGKLNLPNFDFPVVVDLAGMSGTEKNRPALKDHQPGLLVGHTTSIKNDGRMLTAEGVVSGTGKAAREVVSAAANGFPWQASIGAKPTQVQFVPAGQTCQANGQTFEGPVIVARTSTLGEISFVVRGADDNTSARIAAQAAKGAPMTFEQWLESKGFVLASLSDQQKSSLRSVFDATIKASDDDAEFGKWIQAKGLETLTDAQKANLKPAWQAEIKAAKPAKDDIQGVDLVAEQRKAAAAERKRQAALAKIEATYTNRVPAADLSSIMATAIEEGWDADKTELAVMRKERPVHSNNWGGARGGDLPQAEVIEASMALSINMPEKFVAEQIPSDRREKVMNLATSQNFRGFSLHALGDAVISAAGMHFHGSRKSDSYVRTVLEANEKLIRAADGGFATVSLSGVLSNLANKSLMQAFTAVEVIWPYICAVQNMNDFKIHSRYRLDSSGAVKKVGPDGELKSIGLSDATYTNQLDTYGALIALTRQMQINDDLGSFADLPAHLGRLQGLRIEELCIVTLLAQIGVGKLFSATNKNYNSGAGSALGIPGLTAAEQAFRDQVDPNGKPILVTPTRLLVGSALKVTADNLFAEKLLIATSLGSTSSKVVEPARNPHAGKYTPFVSPYISNTAITDQDGKAITGQTSTGWGLFADPTVRAALFMGFLNGQRQPTVESAQTDFNTLGMRWRCFHDFGIGLGEPYAAQWNAGT